MAEINADYKAATSVFESLRNLIVPDLSAMRKWAAEFNQRIDKTDGLGALNFALTLNTLIACEALGFLISGASAHQKAVAGGKQKKHHRCFPIVLQKLLRSAFSWDRLRWPDVGTYITITIAEHFPKDSVFKHLDKILADYLRHSLVHGFGTHQDQCEFEVTVGIESAADVGAGINEEDGRQMLIVNAIALVDATIQAFDAVQKRLSGDPQLCSRIVVASNVPYKVGKPVHNQFKAFRDLLARRRSSRKHKE